MTQQKIYEILRDEMINSLLNPAKIVHLPVSMQNIDMTPIVSNSNSNLSRLIMHFAYCLSKIIDNDKTTFEKKLKFVKELLK